MTHEIHQQGQQTDFLHLQLLPEVDETIHLHYNALLNSGIQSHSQNLIGTEHIVEDEPQLLLVWPWLDWKLLLIVYGLFAG